MHSWRIAVRRDVHAPADVTRRAPVAVLGTRRQRAVVRRGATRWAQPSPSAGETFTVVGVTESRSRGSGRVACSCRTPPSSRRSASRTSRPSRSRPSRPARRRGSHDVTRLLRVPIAIGSGDGSRDRGRARRFHRPDRSGQGADKGALHVGRGVRARQSAAARSDHARRDGGHAAADQQHADRAAGEHRGDLARSSAASAS